MMTAKRAAKKRKRYRLSRLLVRWLGTWVEVRWGRKCGS
jgi:hypothetical protein